MPKKERESVGADGNAGKKSKSSMTMVTASLSSDLQPLATSRVDGLANWLQKHNVPLHGLEFKPSKQCGNTMGVFASQPFAKGDLLFFVPKECIFGPAQYTNTPLTSYLVKQAEAIGMPEQITVELLIWVHMLANKEGLGCLSAYMQSLSDVSPTLLDYPQDLLSALNATNLGASLHKLKHLLGEKAEFLNKIRSSNPQEASAQGLTDLVCSEQGLTWACGHYLSRRYPLHFSPDHASLPLDTMYRESGGLGWGNVGALVPLLDLLNHSPTPPPNTHWLQFEPTPAGLKVLANLPRAIGEELFSDYGGVSVEQMLYAFGCVTETSSSNSISSTISSSSGAGDVHAFAVQLKGDSGVFYIRPGPSIPQVSKASFIGSSLHVH